jgi:hypothetical protein
MLAVHGVVIPIKPGRSLGGGKLLRQNSFIHKDSSQSTLRGKPPFRSTKVDDFGPSDDGQMFDCGDPRFRGDHNMKIINELTLVDGLLQSMMTQMRKSRRVVWT